MYHHVSCGNAIKHPQVATGVCENGCAQEKKDDLQQSEAHMVGQYWLMGWFILGCTTLPSLILVDSSVSLLPKSSKQTVAPIGQWEYRTFMQFSTLTKFSDRYK